MGFIIKRKIEREKEEKKKKNKTEKRKKLKTKLRGYELVQRHCRVALHGLDPEPPQNSRPIRLRSECCAGQRSSEGDSG